MIVSDIKTLVKRQFGDESGVQVTDADILRWINDGQRTMVKQNEGLLETTALSTFTIDVQEYALPADLLIFKALALKPQGQTTYTHIKGLAFSKFNEYIDGWDGDTVNRGCPVVYTLFAGQIRLFPIPDHTATNGIKIYYNRKPTDMVVDGDTIDLPLLYHEAVANYCLQKAFEMDEDYEAAGMKSSEISNDLTTLRGRDDWKEQETYPVITVLQEDLL